MAGYDIAALVVVGIFLIEGLLRGFIAQVIRIVALVLAGYLSVVLGPQSSEMLAPHLGSLSRLIGPTGVFVLSFILIAFIGGKLLLIIRKTAPGLTPLDRLLGALLGLLKAGILIYFITGFVVWADSTRPVRGLGLEGSYVYKWVKEHPLDMGTVEELKKELKERVPVPPVQNNRPKKDAKDEK